MLPRGDELRIAAEATTSGDTVIVGPREASVAEAALPESIVPTVVWAGSQNRHSAPPSGWFEAVMPLPSRISMRCGWSMAGLRLGCEFASPDIEDKCYTKR